MSDNTMKHSVQKALESVAKREGVSVDRVRHEIDIALAAACHNDDPSIQTFWESLPAKGSGAFTAENVIAHFAQIHLDGVD